MKLSVFLFNCQIVSLVFLYIVLNIPSRNLSGCVFRGYLASFDHIPIKEADETFCYENSIFLTNYNLSPYTIIQTYKLYSETLYHFITINLRYCNGAHQLSCFIYHWKALNVTFICITSYDAMSQPLQVMKKNNSLEHVF